jgi:hypothetical protein
VNVSTDKFDITFILDENGWTQDGKWQAYYHNCDEIILRSHKYPLQLRFQFVGKNTIICHASADIELPKKICQSLGGTFTHQRGTNFYYLL